MVGGFKHLPTLSPSHYHYLLGRVVEQCSHKRDCTRSGSAGLLVLMQCHAPGLRAPHRTTQLHATTELRTSGQPLVLPYTVTTIGIQGEPILHT